MDDLEQRLRQAFEAPHADIDTDVLIDRTYRGARRRRQRHVAAVAALVMAALGIGGTLFGGLLDRASGPPVIDEPVGRVAVGDGPCCIAEVQGSVWVMNLGDDTLQRVDSDHMTLSGPIDTGGAGAMAPVGDRLLLTDMQSGSSELFDPQTGQRTRVEGFSSRGNMTYDGRHLWIGSASRGELAQVDPTSGRVLEVHMIRGAPNFDSMAFTDDGVLWATSWDGELLKIDVARGAVTARSKPFPDNTDYVAISAVGERLFAVSGGTPRLLVLDASTGKELDRRELEITGGPAITEQPDGSLWLIRGPEAVDELDPITGETTATYQVPLDSGGEPHNAGALTTTPGSLWLTIWPDGSSQGAVVRFRTETN